MMVIWFKIWGVNWGKLDVPVTIGVLHCCKWVIWTWLMRLAEYGFLKMLP